MYEFRHFASLWKELANRLGFKAEFIEGIGEVQLTH